MAILVVTYHGDKNTRFDRGYYADKHMPLVREIWKPFGLKTATAFFPAEDDAGTLPIGVCVFGDDNQIKKALDAPASKRVMDDVKNFTDVEPSRYRAEPL